jgi:hypothetical protein
VVGSHLPFFNQPARAKVTCAMTPSLPSTCYETRTLLLLEFICSLAGLHFKDKQPGYLPPVILDSQDSAVCTDMGTFVRFITVTFTPRDEFRGFAFTSPYPQQSSRIPTSSHIHFTLV